VVWGSRLGRGKSREFYRTVGDQMEVERGDAREGVVRSNEMAAAGKS